MNLDFSAKGGFLNYTNRLKLNEQIYALSFYLLSAVCVILGIYCLYGIWGNYTLYSNAAAEAQKIKTNISKIQGNNSLSDDQIKEYSNIVHNIVPIAEDPYEIMKVISDLGTLSGLTFDQLLLTSNDVTSDSVKLTLSATGTEAGFLKLLEKYMFATGRFITNSSAEFNKFSPKDKQTAEIGIRMEVNLYSAKLTSNPALTESLSEAELEELQNLQLLVPAFVKNPRQEEVIPTDYAGRTELF